MILSVVLSSSAFAGSSVAKRAAAKMQKNDVRTVTTIVDNVEGSPCIPEGKSYQIDLQVKQASYNRMTSQVEYTWETVKTISVGLQGEVSEVCAE